jgi:hypothetical protein
VHPDNITELKLLILQVSFRLSGQSLC